MTTEERKLIQDLKRIQDEKDFIVAFEKVQRIFGDDTRKRVPVMIWGRYQNIIWRNRHEEWEHDGHRYMSGDNFRNKNEWYEVEAHEDHEPYNEWWNRYTSYRLVYFRGGVYKSTDRPNHENQISLHSIYDNHHLLMLVTSCAPIIRLD